MIEPLQYFSATAIQKATIVALEPTNPALKGM